MPIVRRDPFSDMIQLRDEIGRWFEGVSERGKERKSVAWAPDVDIKETDKEVQIKTVYWKSIYLKLRSRNQRR